MTKEQALNLALDALLDIPIQYRNSIEKDAIAAVCEALAQPEQEGDWEKLYRLEVKKSWGVMKYERDIKPLTRIVPMAEQYSDIISDGGLDPRNKFDAQPEQEPKRWAVFCAGCRKEWSVSYQHPGKSICADCEAKLNLQPEQAQEHAEQLAKLGWQRFDCPACGSEGARAFPKSQRPWVGLTDEERLAIGRELGVKCRLGGNPNIDFDYAHAIEAKLKEKNT